MPVMWPNNKQSPKSSGGINQPQFLARLLDRWKESERDHSQMGVSENSVPLNPMVNDHYPY